MALWSRPAPKFQLWFCMHSNTRTLIALARQLPVRILNHLDSIQSLSCLSSVQDMLSAWQQATHGPLYFTEIRALWYQIVSIISELYRTWLVFLPYDAHYMSPLCLRDI